MLTFYCLVCGKLKKGNVERTELNVCEECSSSDSEEGERKPHLLRMGFSFFLSISVN
jgi:ribosome-binding protein aMBF1 (putative translation factor)